MMSICECDVMMSICDVTWRHDVNMWRHMTSWHHTVTTLWPSAPWRQSMTSHDVNLWRHMTSWRHIVWTIEVVHNIGPIYAGRQASETDAITSSTDAGGNKWAKITKSGWLQWLMTMQRWYPQQINYPRSHQLIKLFRHDALGSTFRKHLI